MKTDEAAVLATRVINVSRDGTEMDSYAEEKGDFDITFECSAAEPAMKSAILALRPRGALIQVGVVGDTPLPINALVAKEIRFQGSHRFHEEFAEAADSIPAGASMSVRSSLRATPSKARRRRSRSPRIEVARRRFT